MCLSIALERPGDILGHGEHLGYEWFVIRNPRMGFRCGYVRLPKGHPWHGLGDGIEVEVHGGLTFAEPDKPCGKGNDDAYWIGFDCGHYGDAPDLSLIEDTRRIRVPDIVILFEGGDVLQMATSDGIVRSQEYVEAECRKLIEQAKAEAPPK